MNAALDLTSPSEDDREAPSNACLRDRWLHSFALAWPLFGCTLPSSGCFLATSQEAEFMSSNTLRLGTMSTALVIVTVILVVTPGASAESKYKVLHKFTGGADGNGPGAALIFDQRGNLYGTTEAGGAGAGCTENPHCGTVFKLAPDSHGGWSETALYSFCSLTNCADGAAPLAGLIFDRAGNLYGTTNLGGSGAFGYRGVGDR